MQSRASAGLVPVAATLSASPASPRPPGTSVVFSASASGGSGSYQYEFWLRAPGGSWTIAQAYGSAATWTWNTTGVAPGNYEVVVFTRAAGTTAPFQATQTLFFTVI